VLTSCFPKTSRYANPTSPSIKQEIHEHAPSPLANKGGLCLVHRRRRHREIRHQDIRSELPEKEYLVAPVGTVTGLPPSTNTVEKFVCEAFPVEFESSAFKVEPQTDQEAVSLMRMAKCFVTVIDERAL